MRACLVSGDPKPPQFYGAGDRLPNPAPSSLTGSGPPRTCGGEERAFAFSHEFASAGRTFRPPAHGLRRRAGRKLHRGLLRFGGGDRRSPSATDPPPIPRRLREAATQPSGLLVAWESTGRQTRFLPPLNCPFSPHGIQPQRARARGRLFTRKFLILSPAARSARILESPLRSRTVRGCYQPAGTSSAHLHLRTQHPTRKGGAAAPGPAGILGMTGQHFRHDRARRYS